MGTLCNRANQTGSCDCYPITGVRNNGFCGCNVCDPCNTCCGPPCFSSYAGPYKFITAPKDTVLGANCFPPPAICRGCGQSTWKKTSGTWNMTNPCNGSPTVTNYTCETSLADPDYFYPYAVNGDVVYLDCSCVETTPVTTSDPMSSTTTEEPTTTTYYPMPMVFKYKGDTDRKINNFSRKDIRKRKLNNLKSANFNFQFVVKPLKLNKSSSNKKNIWEYVSNLGFFHNYQKFSKKLNFLQWTGKKWINLYGDNNLNLDKIEIDDTFSVVFNNDFELIYLSKNLSNVCIEVVNSFFSKLKYDTEVIVEEIRKVKNFNGEWVSIKQGDFTDKSLLDFYLSKEKKQFAEFNHENKKELNEVVKFKNISSGVVFKSMSSFLFIGAGSFGLTGNSLYISDTHLYDSNGFNMSLTGDPTITNNSNYYTSNGFNANFNGYPGTSETDDCGGINQGLFGYSTKSGGCFNIYFARGQSGCGFCSFQGTRYDIDFENCDCDNIRPSPYTTCDNCCYYLPLEGPVVLKAVGSGPVGIEYVNEFWPWMSCYIDHFSVVINGKIMCTPSAWACDGDQITFVVKMTEFAYRVSQFYYDGFFYWLLINFTVNSGTIPLGQPRCNTHPNCIFIPFDGQPYKKIKNISKDIDLSKRKKIDFNGRKILSSQQRKIK